MTILPENKHRTASRVALEETIFLELHTSANTSASTRSNGQDRAENQNNIVICNSLDMSADGVQVVVDDEIAVGSIIRLCIDLPQQAPIFLVGEVKWARPAPNDEGYRLGFSFFDSEDTDINEWKTWLDSMLDFSAY